jgi:hypothetical protein
LDNETNKKFNDVLAEVKKSNQVQIDASKLEGKQGEERNKEFEKLFNSITKGSGLYGNDSKLVQFLTSGASTGEIAAFANSLEGVDFGGAIKDLETKLISLGTVPDALKQRYDEITKSLQRAAKALQESGDNIGEQNSATKKFMDKYANMFGGAELKKAMAGVTSALFPLGYRPEDPSTPREGPAQIAGAAAWDSAKESRLLQRSLGLKQADQAEDEALNRLSYLTNPQIAMELMSESVSGYKTLVDVVTSDLAKIRRMRDSIISSYEDDEFSLYNVFTRQAKKLEKLYDAQDSTLRVLIASEKITMRQARDAEKEFKKYNKELDKMLDVYLVERQKALAAGDLEQVQDIDSKMESMARKKEDAKRKVEEAKKAARENIIFNKFLKGLEEGFKNISDVLNQGSTKWLAKIFLTLFLLGIAIKKGLISTKTIGKVVSFVVKAFVEGIKVVIKMIFLSLWTIVKTIFSLFMGGEFLSGAVLALITVIGLLFILAKTISLVHAAYTGIMTMWIELAKLGPAFSKAFQILQNIAPGFAASLQGIIPGIKSGFSALMSSLQSGFSNLFGSTLNSLGNVINSFGQGLSSAVGKFSSFLSGAGGGSGALSGQGGLTAAGRTFYQNNPEARRSRISELVSANKDRRAAGIPVSAPGKGVTPAAPNTGFMKGIGDGFKSLGGMDVVRAAATIALLSAAMFIAAKAFQEFADVTWGGVITGLTSLAGLILMVKLLKNAFVDVTQSAISIGILAGSLWVLGKALQEFSKVTIGDFALMGVTLMTLIQIYKNVGRYDKVILKGAKTIALLGLSLLPLVGVLHLAKGYDWFSLSLLGLALVGVAGIAYAISNLSRIKKTHMLRGAMIIAAIGASLIPLALALNLAKGLDAAGAGILAASLVVFGFIAYIMSSRLGRIKLSHIYRGAMIIAAIGLAVMPMAIALNLAKGLDVTSVGALVGAVIAFGTLAYLIAVGLTKNKVEKIYEGAKVIAAVGLAILPMAFALSLVKGLSLLDIGILTAAILGFGTLAYLIGTYLKPKQIDAIMKGALVIGAIGLAVLPMAFALSLAKGLDAESVGILVAATAGFGLIGWMMGKLVKQIPLTALLKGALIIGLIGFAIMPMAWALSMAKGIDISTVGVLLAAIVAFTLIAIGLGALMTATAGIGAAAIAAGAGMIALIGLSIIPMALALSYIPKAIDQAAINSFIWATGKMAALAAGMGIFSLVILPGAAAMYILGHAVKSVAEGFAALQGIKIDLEQVKLLDEAIRIMAWRAVKEAVASPAIALGAWAMMKLGESLEPIAKGFAALQGVSIDLGMIRLLDEAIRILAWRAVKEAAFYKLIETGSYALRLLAEALLPMAEMMALLAKAAPNPATMYFFAKSIEILVKAAVYAGEYINEIMMGSRALSFLAKSLRPMVLTFSYLSEVDPTKIRPFIEGVKSLIWVAGFAGIFLGLIVRGSYALNFLGESLKSFAETFVKIRKLEPKAVLSFVWGVRELLKLALYAGIGAVFLSAENTAAALRIIGESFVPFADVLNKVGKVNIDGVSAFVYGVGELLDLTLWAALYSAGAVSAANTFTILGNSLLPFANVLQMISGVNPELIKTFVGSAMDLMNFAIYAGDYEEELTIGAVSLRMLGNAMLPFASALQMVSSVSPDSVLNFLYGVSSVIDMTLRAGSYGAEIITGSASMLLLGHSLSGFSKAFSEIKGINLQDILNFSEGIGMMLDVAGTIGFFASLKLGASSLIMKALGNSLVPFAEAFSKTRGIRKKDAQTFTDSIELMVDGITKMDIFKNLDLESQTETVANTLKKLGESVEPFAVVFNRIRNIESDVIETFGETIVNFVDLISDIDESSMEKANFLGNLGEGMFSLSDGIEKLKKTIGGVFEIVPNIEFLVQGMTGLPENLQSLMNTLSGIELDDGDVFNATMRKIIEIAPELSAFSEIFDEFGTDVLEIFDAIERLSFAGDGLFVVSDGLRMVAQAVRELGGALGSLSDEEMLRFMKVVDSISVNVGSQSGATGVSMVANRGAKGVSAMGGEGTPINEKMFKWHIKAAEIYARSGQKIDPRHIEQVKTKANIPVEMVVNGKKISLMPYLTTDELSEVMTAVNMAAMMRGERPPISQGTGMTDGVTESSKIYSQGSGAVGQLESLSERNIPIEVTPPVSSSIGPSSSSSVITPSSETSSRTIASDARRAQTDLKDFAMEQRQAANTALSVNNVSSTNVTNNTRNEAPVIRSTPARDQNHTSIRQSYGHSL